MRHCPEMNSGRHDASEKQPTLPQDAHAVDHEEQTNKAEADACVMQCNKMMMAYVQAKEQTQAGIHAAAVSTYFQMKLYEHVN